MRPSYQLFIAFRYLRAKKRHRGISFNTVISISGVTLGVMALIVVLSVMSGFHEDLRNKILGVNAHLIVLSYQGKIGDYREKIERLLTVPEVTSASPFVLGQVMLSKDGRAQGVYLRGVDPEYESRTTIIEKRMKAGSFDALEKDAGQRPPIILGSELASALGVYLGDTLRVISPTLQRGPLGMIPRVREFTVAGIFEIGMYEYDANLAITSLRTAQEFFQTGDTVNGIEVTLMDIYRADEMRERIPEILGPNYYGRDWMQMNRNLFSALKLEKFTMFVILTLIVLVAAFNIVSTLIMNVLEKEREIAILKAMGATNRAVMGIFVLQGLIIGLTGTVLGVILGYTVGYLIDNYQIIKLPADVYYLSHLPVKMKVVDFVVVSLSALVITLLATVYPALQAARLNPIEPLRYE